MIKVVIYYHHITTICKPYIIIIVMYGTHLVILKVVACPGCGG